MKTTQPGRTKTLGPPLSNPHEMNPGPQREAAIAELRAKIIVDRGNFIDADSGALLARLSDCTVAFAHELAFRHDAHADLVAALRDVIESAGPLDADAGEQAGVVISGEAFAAIRAALAKAGAA